MVGNRKHFETIGKIWFGKETWVFNKHSPIPAEEKDYLHLMRYTFQMLDNPIGVEVARSLPRPTSFENFNAAGDRAAFRKISKEQHDFLIKHSK